MDITKIIRNIIKKLKRLGITNINIYNIIIFLLLLIIMNKIYHKKGSIGIYINIINTRFRNRV